jgi:hypothetical protein
LIHLAGKGTRHDYDRRRAIRHLSASVDVTDVQMELL